MEKPSESETKSEPEPYAPLCTPMHPYTIATKLSKLQFQSVPRSLFDLFEKEETQSH